MSDEKEAETASDSASGTPAKETQAGESSESAESGAGESGEKAA